MPENVGKIHNSSDKIQIYRRKKESSNLRIRESQQIIEASLIQMRQLPEENVKRPMNLSLIPGSRF